MNIYRYKHYDFIREFLPLGFEWKEPQVFALESPDEDYELFQDQEFMDNFVAEKYELNELEGRKYKNLISAKISNMVTMGLITIEQAETYGESTSVVRGFLSEGYWHSAYFAITSFIPPEALLVIHNELKDYIKNYVNLKYPIQFKID